MNPYIKQLVEEYLDEAVNTSAGQWISIIEQLYGKEIKDICISIVNNIKSSIDETARPHVEVEISGINVTLNVDVVNNYIKNNRPALAEYTIGTLCLTNKTLSNYLVKQTLGMNNKFPDFMLKSNNITLPFDVKTYLNLQSNGAVASGKTINTLITDFKLNYLQKLSNKNQNINFINAFKQYLTNNQNQTDNYLSSLILFMEINVNDSGMFMIIKDSIFIIPLIYTFRKSNNQYEISTKLALGTGAAKTMLPKDFENNIIIPDCLL